MTVTNLADLLDVAAIGCLVVAVVLMLRLFMQFVRRPSFVERGEQVLEVRQSIQPSVIVKSVSQETTPPPAARESISQEAPTARVQAPVAPPPFFVGTGAGFTVAIVGESYRQTALRAISDGRRRRGVDVVFDALVYAEPTNEYDPNAVRVDDRSGRQLGYLSREDARAYRRVFEALHTTGRVGHCRGKLIGGTLSKPSIGVILDLEEHTELSARLAAEDQPF